MGSPSPAARQHWHQPLNIPGQPGHQFGDLLTRRWCKLKNRSAEICFPAWFVNGSGHLFPSFIAIRWDKLLPTDVEIIRPPLHHLCALVEVLRFADIRSTNVVTFLMAHLALHGVFRPAP